jgi:hypothetical protein
MIRPAVAMALVAALIFGFVVTQHMEDERARAHTMELAEKMMQDLSSPVLPRDGPGIGVAGSSLGATALGDLSEPAVPRAGADPAAAGAESAPVEDRAAPEPPPPEPAAQVAGANTQRVEKVASTDADGNVHITSVSSGHTHAATEIPTDGIVCNSKGLCHHVGHKDEVKEEEHAKAEQIMADQEAEKQEQEDYDKKAEESICNIKNSGAASGRMYIISCTRAHGTWAATNRHLGRCAGRRRRKGSALRGRRQGARSLRGRGRVEQGQERAHGHAQRPRCVHTHSLRARASVVFDAPMSSGSHCHGTAYMSVTCHHGPGAGNTWMRLLVEKGSGLRTGAVFGEQRAPPLLLLLRWHTWCHAAGAVLLLQAMGSSRTSWGWQARAESARRIDHLPPRPIATNAALHSVSTVSL